MSTVAARTQFILSARDQTAAGIGSARRSLLGLEAAGMRVRTAFAGMFAGALGGAILTRAIRSFVEINKATVPVKSALENLDGAWTAFGLKVGEAGLSTALVNFANGMNAMISGSNGLSSSIGKLMGGAVNSMARVFEGVGRAMAFAYDNFVPLKNGLYSFAAIAIASRIIQMSRGFVLFVSTLRAASIATGLFTLFQRRMLLFWTTAIAVGAKLTNTFEDLTSAVNKAFEAGEKLLPQLGDGLVSALGKLGLDTKALASDFGKFTDTFVNFPPIVDTAAGSTKKFASGLKSMKDAGEEASSTLKEVGQTFSSSFSSAFQSVIDRTSSVKDAFASMVQSILSSLTNLFANQAMQQLGGMGKSGAFGGLISSLLGGYNTSGPGGTTSLSGFGGFYAKGGSLGAGKVGIVGEAGPEAIVGPATVIPNRDLGGAVNLKVNIINQAGVDVQQKPSPDGRGLDVLITNKVNSVIGSGKADANMRARYGATPQKARR